MLTEEELNNLEEFNGPEINGVSANADAWEVNAMVRRIKELEAENARLRQQRDAANAQLDWLIEQTGTKRVTRSNMDECE
ncbi:hypothetical protein ONQ20_22065 [Salmonella enterica subsp. enterica serovar Cerro]|uniref:Uncharacterized protein n=3 Tax=Cornellvirus TaxID=1910993 RepID=S4TTQ6_9CAUD|nr:hypothetical protein N275_gp01 [Salmonella phage FSL SP-031]AGF88947.1 hypothetical protein SP049_00130 [Salmonella phage FSL SP-049]AGF89598.1 hypothetical protein SP038_00045 [Salmonella phage FSL SP-038]ECF9291686.1 hypothetical protein [Salmonella enterica]ECX6244415.1 hypothetical protein [Salmonella enterica subsp. enterica serovar Dublin]KAA6709256.1 hypothetical protein E5A26_21800 [Salmonella enterica subsp. enterica serovar Cerro]